jgi:tRNA threonylcarbamoyl adenosine modification protein YeaZ
VTPPDQAVRLLAIDTCLAACSAAVAVDSTVRASQYEERRSGHAEAIVPMIERVLADAAVAPSSIDRIVVTIGPGTFAGVRVALAAAEGLRLATGAALIPVSSLWAIGQRVLAERAPRDPRLAIAVDAGGDHVYLECLEAADLPGSGPTLLPIGTARETVLRWGAALAGSGARQLAAGTGTSVLVEEMLPRASDVVVPAAILPVADGVVRPLYLRRADFVRQSAPEGIRA